GQTSATKLVVTLPSLAGSLAIDWNGKGYLLAVSRLLPEGGLGIEGTVSASALDGLLLTADLDKSGDVFPISNLRWANAYPSGAQGTGGAFLIGWDHAPAAPIIFGARVAAVDSAGRLTKTDGEAVEVAPADQVPAALAASADGFLGIWSEPDSAGRT